MQLGKIRKLIEKYMGIIIYLFFGVLTTGVNYLVYFPLYNWFDFAAVVSNAAAWLCAAAFAFLTNKPFVFKSYDWSAKVVVPELLKFLGTRIGSGLIETGIILVTVDILHWDGNLMKLFTSVLVVIINYAGSKMLVFKR